MTRKTKIFGYSRVSPNNTNSTSNEFEGEKIDEVYVDKVSIKAHLSPTLDKLVKSLQKGDEIVVHSFDQLTSNPIKLQNVLVDILAKGATLRTIVSGITVSKNPEDNVPFLKSLLCLNMFNIHLGWQKENEEKEHRCL